MCCVIVTPPRCCVLSTGAVRLCNKYPKMRTAPHHTAPPPTTAQPGHTNVCTQGFFFAVCTPIKRVSDCAKAFRLSLSNSARHRCHSDINGPAQAQSQQQAPQHRHQAFVFLYNHPVPWSDQAGKHNMRLQERRVVPARPPRAHTTPTTPRPNSKCDAE